MQGFKQVCQILHHAEINNFRYSGVWQVELDLSPVG